jgi:hypothetical protein
MNRITAFKSAGIMTTVTMFITSILLLLLNFSGGLAFRIAEISLPFVFFGVNLLLRALLGKVMCKNAMRILLVCVNLALTAVYAVLLLRL